MALRIHCLRHVSFEDEAHIGSWARTNGHSLSATNFYAGQPLPELKDFDWLVVMGGPMNVHEEFQYPWLAGEKQFIRKAVDAGKSVLGICLGAQLLADVLSGSVDRNPHQEIGWWPLRLSADAGRSQLFRGFPETFTAFHWHGDTFSLPTGALAAASSQGCVHQAFVHQERVVGLQFHLETTAESMERLIDNCGDEIDPGKYVQTIEAMRAEAPTRLPEINALMDKLLTAMAGQVRGKKK